MINLFESTERLRKLLDYHLERHAVLSSNIANIETPGFTPKDVRFESALSDAVSRLETTSSRHLPAPSQMSAPASIFDDPTPNATDRSAMLEREMSKVAANTVRYEAIAELVRRRMAMLRYAASDGGSS